MLVPAGTVMEVAPDAGFADASALGGVVCESHCEAVCLRNRRQRNQQNGGEGEVLFDSCLGQR